METPLRPIELEVAARKYPFRYVAYFVFSTLFLTTLLVLTVIATPFGSKIKERMHKYVNQPAISYFRKVSRWALS